MSKRLPVAALLAALVTPTALANDVVVAPGQSIQAAIDASVAGDRVLVQPGTYVEQLHFDGKDLAVIGLGGPTATIVDGGGAGPVVRFDAGQTANARLQGLTIRNGTATIGAGGIQASGSTPTIEDCIVTLNHGKFGGGVSGSPTMRRCAILQNGASLTHGGGVYGSPNMEDCVVAQNTVSSADGGGLYLTGGTCEIRNCFVVANTIVQGDPAHGAGVTVHSSATVHLDHCVIANNRAFGNVFGSYGGGVWATPTTTIESCTIVGNLAQNGNATGGGVYGAAKIVNSIVRGNTPDELAGSPVVTWSNVLGGYAGVGNVDGVPRFVDEFGTVDLHLLPNSPCIDRGDPAKFDADGTRSDIGAFAYQRLYTRGNGIAWSLDEASFAAISTATGGRQVMRLALGADGTGDVYLLLGSMSGTAPGVPLGSVTLPLVQDAYTDATLLAPGSVGLVGTLGVLGANGTGEASFALPPNVATAFTGAVLHHAALTVDLATFAVGTTNALRLELVP